MIDILYKDVNSPSYEVNEKSLIKYNTIDDQSPEQVINFIKSHHADNVIILQWKNDDEKFRRQVTIGKFANQ
jgi:hypothetical protein